MTFGNIMPNLYLNTEQNFLNSNNLWSQNSFCMPQNTIFENYYSNPFQSFSYNINFTPNFNFPTSFNSGFNFDSTWNNARGTIFNSGFNFGNMWSSTNFFANMNFGNIWGNLTTKTSTTTSPTKSTFSTESLSSTNAKFDISFWEKQGYSANRGKNLSTDVYTKYMEHGGKWEPGKCAKRTNECINRVFNINNGNYGNGCQWGRTISTNPLLKDKFKKVSLSWVKEHGLPDGSVLVWPSSYFKSGAAASCGHVAIAHNGQGVSNCIMGTNGVSEVWIPIA